MSWDWNTFLPGLTGASAFGWIISLFGIHDHGPDDIYVVVAIGWPILAIVTFLVVT